MVKSLEEAIVRIRQLPEADQILLARFMVHELDEDRDWRQTSEGNSEQLGRLVEEITAEDDRGDCPGLRADQL